MSTTLKTPPTTTQMSVADTEYDVDDDGCISVSNPEHIEQLLALGAFYPLPEPTGDTAVPAAGMEAHLTEQLELAQDGIKVRDEEIAALKAGGAVAAEPVEGETTIDEEGLRVLIVERDNAVAAGELAQRGWDTCVVERDAATSQIERLAEAIVEIGLSIEDEGAVDCAIRHLRDYKETLEGISDAADAAETTETTGDKVDHTPEGLDDMGRDDMVAWLGKHDVTVSPAISKADARKAVEDRVAELNKA